MIALNGLGRIGRLVVQRLMQARPELLCALNDPADLDSLVHLLRFDSVHGPSPLRVEGRREGGREWLLIDGRLVPLFHETEPGDIPFESAGARLVVEASGRFTQKEAAARHLKGEIQRVVISAPSPDADYTIIAPINGQGLRPEHRVVSNASCTAHATAPLLDVLDRAFGLEACSLSTVHVVTNDQRLLDNKHKDLRRARSAFRNIIPTTTSAVGALKRVFPDHPAVQAMVGTAIRVPTLSVNMLDLTATLQRDTDLDQLRGAFEAASRGRLLGILDIAEGDPVSSDFIGSPASVILDTGMCRVLGARFVKLVAWHDNETGYAARLCDLVVDLAGRH